MRAYLKFFAFLLCLSCFFLTTLPLWPWLQWDALRMRPCLISQSRIYARLIKRILGLRVRLNGQAYRWEGRTGQMIVTNHLGYIDIVVLASLRRSCFVTSHDLREKFGLGQIVQLAGCLFVECSHRLKQEYEVGAITQALESGLDVVIFPEATSTNGEQIFPITINYTSLDGGSVTQANRDLLFWYGEMSFLPHFFRLLRARSIEVELHVSTPLLEQVDTAQAAEKAHICVSRSFRPLIPSLEVS